MHELGSPTNPLTVAIVGSGPSGFYAAEALLQTNLTVQVTMIERLPVPYGLVRSGVAPDHPKLKQPILVYDKIAQAPAFSFFGNVHVGKDIAISELRSMYHTVILAYGAQSDRHLGIPGERLSGVHGATEFVGWYNGHPDYRDCVFDLSQEVVVIIGQGNVAIDVARILAKTIDELKHTDIAEHALDALVRSKVRDIHIIGRRGPAQAKFTSQELQELGKLSDCAPYVNSSDLDLSDEDLIEVADKMNRNIAKNMEIFARFAGFPKEEKRRRCYLHFLQSPIEIVGQTRVEGIRLAKNRLVGSAFQQTAEQTDMTTNLACGLVFRSIGYKGISLDGVPFDPHRGVFPNREGRVVDNSGTDLYGLYVTGWIKRGPTGVIGTNRADSVATVNTVLADLPMLHSAPKMGAVCFAEYLRKASVPFVTYSDWKKLDYAEIQRGSPKGKPREKFTRVQEMLGLISN